jgi:superfamily I DNA/RNA helicase/RecB family exonuclease
VLGNIHPRDATGVPGGAHLALGAAGTGKTSFLVRRFAELVRAGEQGIVLLVHSRRAARRLGDELLRDLGASTDQVRVFTWHAFALSLLREHHRALGYRREPALLTGPEQFTLVRELLGRPAEREHWAAFPKQRRLAGFVEELREFVLRAQDALMAPEDLEQKARELGRADLEQAARFFRRYLDEIDKREDPVIDHANVIAQAWYVMTKNEDVAARVRAHTTHLLADDYQDATPAQHALLRALFVPGGSVAVAANPGARIYGFRGAHPDAVARFRTDFAPVREIALDAVHRGTPEPEAWLFDHLTEEADAVARECLRLRAREGIGFGRTAIVVRRYGAGARAIRRALDRAGVAYVVVGENRPLQQEAALRPMLDLARAALRRGEEEDLLPGLLVSPVVGLDRYTERMLRREARVRGMTLTAMVQAPPEELPERVREKLRALWALFEEVRDADANARRADDVFWLLWGRLGYFRDMVTREDADALDAVAAFSRAIERFSERRPGKTFDDYLDVLEGVEFGPEPWNMPEDRRANAVRILTAHQAAGEEFDAVVVAGCVEGDFPDAHQRHAMFDLRDLLAPGETPFDRRKARGDEERRLFGVAASRARVRLLFTAALESSQHESQAPSPFVSAAGIEWTRPAERDAVARAGADALTRDEAEAAARRALRDADAGEETKRAAVDLLARLPGVDTDAWWYERDWTDPGTAIAPDLLHTSYSRLTAYDNCALQYLYQVELGLDTETSHQMLVGTWVHDIVDRCARGEIEQTEDALVAALDELWDPAVFESVAIEHRRRIDSEEMLRRWLRVDGKLDTLASEVAFEFPIDGATMRGRIDRVVRLGGSSVRLIDYKTARHSKSQHEVDEDLQLASYYLALKRDPNLAALGEPRYLELAYLGDFYRDAFMRRGISVDPKKAQEFEQVAQARLEGFVAGIKAEKFAPSPSANCQWCRFKMLCPVWPEGDEVAL